MKRLQVMVEESELAEIQAAAKGERMTTSEWVRRALRVARGAYPPISTERRLQVLRDASRHSFPAPDIEEMLKEIERGSLGSPSS